MDSQLENDEEVLFLAQSIENSLADKYGQLIPSRSLWRELSYPSMTAMQRSISRGSIGVPTFGLQHRRGRFALTRDVAFWLAKQRCTAKPLSGISNE
ncbi:hypothetical protein D3C87_840190 [compost metagenome]|uniref:hypothetical protein n=1 Tax=Pseudomonas fluorescens TaxID=294 RepID=UPI000FB419C5|nr:hypothetical protein [Pseudomonas fluorescens]